MYEHPGCFSRERGAVSDETVINYLGVDRPAEMPTLAVQVCAGDMLYIPFGWWHEVSAEPDERAGICASASHFYHPYYCRLGGPSTTELAPMLTNPRYRHLWPEEIDRDPAFAR